MEYYLDGATNTVYRCAFLLVKEYLVPLKRSLKHMSECTESKSWGSNVAELQRSVDEVLVVFDLDNLNCFPKQIPHLL